jgi:hypothetical protein
MFYEADVIAGWPKVGFRVPIGAIIPPVNISLEFTQPLLHSRISKSCCR